MIDEYVEEKTLVTCPYCSADPACINLDPMELHWYWGRPRSTALNLRHHPSQRLIEFCEGLDKTRPCPHLLQLNLCLMGRANRKRRTGVPDWSLDVEWWHDCMDGKDNPLVHFIFEQHLEESTPEKFRGTIQVRERPVEVIWRARDDAGRNRCYECSGTAFFAGDLKELARSAPSLRDEYAAWLSMAH